MATMKSSRFGEMKFIYGWVVPGKMTLNNEEYDILIEAEASAGQEILPVQEEQYTDYLNNKSSYEDEISKAIDKSSVVDAKFKPTTLRFERNGGVSVMMESSLDRTIRGTYRIKPAHKFEKIYHI